MKKAIKNAIIVVIVLGAAFIAYRTYTKSFSPATTASYDKDGLTIGVNYSQPSKKGRQLFGGLVPYGKVWRTGANEATVISFNQAVTVAGKPLEAGNYSLWTIPTATDWTIILNKETGQWGTQYNAKEDILRVQVPAQRQTSATEQFTIQFIEQPDGADMQLQWDQTSVLVPLRKR